MSIKELKKDSMADWLSVKIDGLYLWVIHKIFTKYQRHPEMVKGLTKILNVSFIWSLPMTKKSLRKKLEK